MDSSKGSWLVVVGLAAGLLAPQSAFAQSSLAAAPAAEGQGAATAPARGDRRWSIAVDPLGGVVGGPAGDLEDAMRSAHFGDTSQGFLGPHSHPFSSRGCQLVLFRRSCEDNLPAFEINRRLRTRWSMAMVFSRTPVGGVTGYHDGAWQYLALDHRADSFGALVSIGGGAGQIGIGPALHVARVREAAGPSGVAGAWTSHSKLGFVARAGATVPARSRLFVDMRVEYHFAGRMPLGPYTPEPLFGGSPATFPPSSARFNYWFVGLGPGLRF